MNKKGKLTILKTKTTGTKKTRTPNRTQWLPWPEEARQPHKEMVEFYTILQADLLRNHNRGIRPRNKFYVAEMIPIFTESVEGIANSCRIICQLLPEKRQGRHPRWFTTTMNIRAITLGMMNIIEGMYSALEQGKFVLLRECCEALQDEAEEIGLIFEEHPYRTGVPEVWQEAVQSLDMDGL